jgi:PAS domain S-box-containing protein
VPTLPVPCVNATLPEPEDEAARPAAPARYGLGESVADEALDRITHLAAALFGAPMAFISFVDGDQVRLKSKIGIDATAIPRPLAICTDTPVSHSGCLVPDTLQDERLRDHPQVVGALRIRFFAGAPLITRSGQRLGMLAVCDTKPRHEFGAASSAHLETLARLATNELDLQNELAARDRAEHDLKLANELILAAVEAPDVNGAIETSLSLICAAVGAAHGRAWTMLGASDQCQLVAAWSKEGSQWATRLDQQRRRPLTLSNSLVGRVLRSQKRMVVGDLAATVEEFPAARDALAIGLGSLVCVPVQQSGRVFALNIMFEQNPPALDALADRVEDLAAKIRPVLSRRIAEEEIALLRSVLTHANDAVVVAEGEQIEAADGWRIVYVSPAITPMTGFGAEQLEGAPVATLWGKDAAGRSPSILAPIIATGEPARIEIECRRQDGTRFWADISAVPLYDSRTGDRRLIAIFRDMTERRMLEEALRQSESTFRVLFASNPIPMWVHDSSSRRILEVNNAAIAQYGYARERFLQMRLDEIDLDRAVTDIAPEPATPLSNFGRLGICRHRRAGGDEIPVDIAMHRMEFQGRPAVIVAAIDVTEQKRAEEEIRSAKEAAEAASRAKSELLANMSHELRTPLNAIIGFSEIMQAGLFGPLGSAKYEGYVADIRHSAGHLLTVINDILDLAKIEANSFRLHEEPIEPGDIIVSALRLVKPRADDAEVELRYDQRHPDLVIQVDETAMKRVLINLLSNAVKFSDSGSTVTVRSEFTAQGAFSIAVCDEGIGMSEEEIPIALTPFRQVNAGLQRKYEGTGLGLPIAKQLVEMHGGSLTIESARGKGTIVRITLPRARVMEAA